MVNIGLIATIVDRGREAFGQPDRAVDTSQQEGTKIRRQRPTLEISPDRVSGNGRKTQLVWARIAHAQASCGLDGMDVSHLPFYQRLTRGLCCFMKNSG